MFKDVSNALATRRSLGESVKLVNHGFDLFEKAKTSYDKLIEKITYKVEIPFDYTFYVAVVKWVNPLMSTKTFMTHNSHNAKALLLVPNNSTRAEFSFEGFRYALVSEKKDKKKGGLPTYEREFETPHLTITCRSKPAFDALTKKLTSIFDDAKNKTTPKMFTVGGYEDWNESENPLLRDLDSVFLAPGLKEDIVADLQTFFDSKDKLHAIGLPWHRGYLFYGPPGNGKTSISKAIADHYELSIYTLSLAGVKSDRALINMLQDVRPRSVLLIEDIDIYSKVISREENAGVTLSGVLNALDGVMTPDGLITILTTNVESVLDEALKREGRIDKQFYIGKPTRTQIIDIFATFYGEPLSFEPAEFDSMSAVVGILKKHPFDAEAARLKLKETT